VPALGIVIGLVLGLVAGGRLDNLLEVRFRWLWLVLLAFVARLALDQGLAAGAVPDWLRPFLVAAIYAALTLALLANRSLPGVTAAAIGTAANGLVIVANGGWMPVWQPTLAAAGLDSTTVHSNFHSMLTGPLDLSFLLHGGPLVDLIPIPVPPLQSVVSIGDVLLGAGLGFFVFAATVRLPAMFPAPAAAAPAAAVEPARGAFGHAYVRLATNGSFAAMWLGQVISSLGDRIHQVALVFLVARATDGSPLALGLVFAAVTVPGLIVGPFAGALVDRWDRKRVMVASDVIRAAIVCLIPLASVLHVALIVVLVFALSAVSSFFRPARAAALPRVVPDQDLLTANSAMWVADTVSDLVGYGLGGLFVAFLGSSLVMAFWLDGVSYLASAALIAAIVIPPLTAGAGHTADEGTATEAPATDATRLGPLEEGGVALEMDVATHAPAAGSSILSDMAIGWRFMRAEAVLLATTVQAAVAEYGLGALTALSPLLVAGLAVGTTDAPTAYGAFEMVMGVGLVAGGVVVGGIAERLPKGPSIIVAFTALGLAIAAMAATGNLYVALAMAAVVGLANVTFVVPSQTLFQQRTPDQMLGLVVSIRLAVVNGVLALAMATSGALAEVFGLRPVLLACGLLTAAAGLAGFAIRSIRRA
jgi:MFS transporter, DHA3 family, macrolide efflux protein